MMVALLLVLHLGLAATLVYGIGWLALIPWRRAKHAHWTERARLLWPARVTNGLLFFTAPVTLAALQLKVFPHLPPTYLYTGLAGIVGAALGMWPMTQAIFPHMRFRGWLRELAALLALRLFSLGVLIAAGLSMPYELNWVAIPLTAGVLATMLWSIYGGTIWLLRVAGVLAEAPPRLVGIVREVAERMQLPMPRLWLLRAFGANALALPVLNVLLITEGAAEALSDEELAAVCAHEFGHLSEPKGVIAARILTTLSPLPAIFIKPALHLWSGAGCIVIGVAMILTSRVTRNFRHRMEKRADSVATGHQGAPPEIYARTLERLYQVNQVPAVMSKNMVHPSLYDRLLAAGVTPSYPRPAPPARFSWQRMLAMLLLFVSVFIGINRFTSGEDEKRPHRRHKTAQWMEP